MKQFISQDGDAVVISNMPIKVNSKTAKQIEISEEDLLKINDSKYTFKYVSKKFEFTERPISQKAIKRQELRDKAIAGTLTDADIKEALKLLL